MGSMRSMTTFDKWDVVLVPFPFTDLSQAKKRPAVVLSPREYNVNGDAVIGFLTSNLSGTERLGDFVLIEPEIAGLPLPTRFRLKLATIDVSIVAKRLGALSVGDRKGIALQIHALLG